MEIKRFRARDSRSAMAQVRAALGPDAIILANRRLSDGVEIVATAELDPGVQGASPGSSEQPGRADADGSRGNEIMMQQLQNELAQLRNVLEDRLQRSSWRDSVSRDPVHAALQQRLARLGLSRAVAGAIADRLPRDGGLEARWRLAQEALSARLARPRPLRIERGTALACVGATGVGKTSTLAKLAGQAALEHGPDTVALICTDTRRVGASEQLAAHAGLLGIPCANASSGAALDEALDRFRWRRVFIDTAGLGTRDARRQEQLDLLAGRAMAVSVCLVLSASAQAAQTRDLTLAFGPQALAGAIISKVDEATSLGGVIDALVRSRLPAVMLGTGQRVPDDLQAASADGLVRRAVALMEARAQLPDDSAAVQAVG